MNSKILPDQLITFMEKLETPEGRKALEKERITKTEKEFSCAHGVSIFRITQLMGPAPKKELIPDETSIDPEMVNRLRRGTDTEKPLSDMAIARLLGTSNQKIIVTCGRRKDVINPYSRFGRPASECSTYIEPRILNTHKWETQKEGNEYWRGVGELQENTGPHKSIGNFIGRWTTHPKMN